MENVIYLLVATIAGAFGYSQYLKTKASKGQVELDNKLKNNQIEIDKMKEDLDKKVDKHLNQINDLQNEQKKEVRGEELAKFFNDLFNKSK